MRFLADENADNQIVDLLRRSGYTVDSIVEDSPGLADEEIIKTSNKTGSILITADKGFGEYIVRFRRASKGVILLRLAGMDPDAKAAILLDTVKMFEEQLIDHFVVVTATHCRIRPIQT